MSKSINVGQPLFNNIEGHPFILGPQGPYRTKEEARRALIAFYKGKDEIPNGQECIIAGVKFIWRGDDLYESLAVKTINENQTDLNFYKTPGTYRFDGIRNNNFANLPINNNNSNASITGELVVYSSVEGTTTYRSIIGQVLFLSNAEGHETKIYTRSANKTSKDGGATYEVTWGDWQVCQGMKEVGLVSSYDSFIDNGMYSGVYNNNGIIETFVLITINDYVIKSQLGATKSISQLKYALNAHSSKSELSVRVGKGEPLTWNDWKSVSDAESITTQITDIQNRLNALTEGTTGNINDIVNKAVNDIVGGAPEAYDTLKEIVDYINKNKDEVTGQVTDIVTSINELQNLKVIDFGGNFTPDKIVSTIINHIKDNNIKHAVLFKYLDNDQSSVLGVCISRQINTDTNIPTGWIIYLIAKKGIERLQYNSAGSREAWNEYGGILRHQQNTIGDGQLETMSVNGLKSLIVDNLNTNEDANNRNLLSILSANQGRILDEKINANKIIVVDNLTSTSATNALSANMGRMLAQEILKMASKTYVDIAIANSSEVFVAIYGKTTFDEISEAYNTGKTVILNHNKLQYRLSWVLLNNMAQFFSHGDQKVFIAKCASNNAWSTQSYRNDGAVTNHNDKTATITIADTSATVPTKEYVDNLITNTLNTEV